MKTLNLQEMEIIKAGSFDCFLRGVGITTTTIGGFFFAPLWGALAAIAFTSGHCMY